MNGPLLAAILAWPTVDLARIIAAYSTAKRRDQIKAASPKTTKDRQS